MAQVLITGGAGFIGSHTADALIEQGHEVTVLDLLEPDVHGPGWEVPGYLNPATRLVRADVRDEGVVGELARDTEVVFHLAACTGVGQSMYQLRRYSQVNVEGTATLLEALVRRLPALRRLVVASSRAVYGEGEYRCGRCGMVVTPPARARAQLEAAVWEPSCPGCAGLLEPQFTTESATLSPGSLYGVTKLAQEQASLVVGAAHGLPVVALRYFNVFGPRQSLRNPYTGVISTFVNRVRAGRAPEVYEDGHESRDFVHVSDVVRANLLAMESEDAVGRVVNVGSGSRVSLLEVARAVSTALGGPPPEVTGQFRMGDIRHCFADVALARDLLGYKPAVMFADGVRRLVGEIANDDGEDRSAEAEAELRGWGLSSGGRG